MIDNTFPAPLVDVEWLAAHRNDPRLVVVCASMGNPERSVAEGIPGAQLADIEASFSREGADFPHTVPVNVKAPFEALGISDDSLVVVYDRHGLVVAPRVWWLARVAGLENAAVLDGGLPAYKAAGGETAPLGPPRGGGTIVAQPRPELLVGLREVEAAQHRDDCVVVDARSAGRFAGIDPEPRGGVRRGHIPGSVNVPFESLVGEDRCLLPAETLREVFDAAVGDASSVICSCGSGVTACVDALAAVVAGRDGVVVYDGSWAQWGSERLNQPIAT